MYERFRHCPVLDSYPSRIPAAVWNTWRRYRLHVRREACFGLGGLLPLSPILSDEDRVIVDSSLYDLPVLVWSDFRDVARGALHEPVPCTVRHYHQGASRIRDQALRLMAHELEARIKGKHG